MKKAAILALSFLILFISCKKEEKFAEPDFVLQKWSEAIKSQNYKNYKRYEANPKSPQVFREIYREFYFSDVFVVEIEDLDKEKIKEDHEGNPYLQRSVTFECTEVKRKTGKPVKLVRGNVLFIKYTEGKRKKEGWLMFNRTLTRMNR